MIEVKRREREGYEVLLRRFFREVQQAGLLTEAKRRRFYEKPLSRTKLRQMASRKIQRRKMRQGY